jgi:hypothetical protein
MRSAVPRPKGAQSVNIEGLRLKDPNYLGFIRSRPCLICGDPRTDPHHALRRLRGISAAGMAQKGSDYLAIPLCRVHHDALHRGSLKLQRGELLEFIVINLICYLETLCRESAKCNAKRLKT